MIRACRKSHQRSGSLDGVSRVEEDEEPLDPLTRRDCMAEPEKILSSAAESRVLISMIVC